LSGGLAPVTTRRIGAVEGETPASWALRQFTGHPMSDALLRELAATAGAVLGGPPWYFTGDADDLARTCQCPSDHLAFLLDHLSEIGAIRWRHIDGGAVYAEVGRYAHVGDLAPYFAPPHPPVPSATRLLVMRRDGYRCVQCGSAEDVTLDHIEPQVYGGGHDPSNLRVLCRSCNSQKGARG
jgi:hypothetical protein